MSDFLTRIAERIRPGPPMVHPLAIPIFERVDSGFALAPETGGVALVQSEGRAPSFVGAHSHAGAFLETEPQPGRRGPPRSFEHRLSDSSGRPVGGEATITPQSEGPRRSPEQETSDRPDLRRQTVAAPSTLGAETLGQEIVQRSAASWESPPAEPIAQTAYRGREAVTPTIRAQPLQDPDEGTRSTAGSSLRPTDALERSTEAPATIRLQPDTGDSARFVIRRSEALEPILPPELGSLSRPRRTNPSQVFSAQHSPPEIHVTIGRIEFRAPVQSPPARENASRRTPMLSLDEYLRSRNGSAA
jgi:hypothetical protein